MDTGLEQGAGIDADAAHDAGSTRPGDDLRERLRARLAMANSQVLPHDDTADPASGSTRTLSPRTPKPSVWQESAAEARRKLWGAATEASEAAPSTSSAVLVDTAAAPVAEAEVPVVGEPDSMPPPVVVSDAPPVPVGEQIVAPPFAAPLVAPSLVAPSLDVPSLVAPSLDAPSLVTLPTVVEPDPIQVPIELPVIVEASPVPAASAEPALAPMLVLPAAPGPARTQPRIQQITPSEPPPNTSRVTSKKPRKVKVNVYHGQKRHPIRRFFGFLIVVALIGGAAYFGWYKYIRKAATWSSELKPAATFVEKTLHREFDKTVAVVTLDPAAYEAKLVTHVLGQLYANPTVGSDLGTGAAAVSGLQAGPVPQSYALRAVGLVGADPPASVGGILAAHTTSFYSGTDHTIYRTDGTTAMFQVDMLRSLAAALIDQAVDTTASYARISDAARTGLRGMVDAVANSVVVAQYKELLSLQPSRDHELQTRLAALPDPATPLYLYPYLSSYEIGGLGYDVVDPANPLAGLATPADDGTLFDPSRAPSVAPEGATTSPSTRSLGMEFWFDALTPTLGVEAARQAALLWTGDTSNPSESSGQACLSSTISTADPTNQAALLAAMTQWVATRPATSFASAAAAGTNGVTVSMCSAIDVVEAVPTAEAEPMGTLFVRADEERYLLGRAVQLGLPAAPAARACAVTAYRNGAINGVAPTAVDADTVARITDIVTFCSAAG